MLRRASPRPASTLPSPMSGSAGGMLTPMPRGENGAGPYQDDKHRWCRRCGHSRWDHRGIFEPGCSYLGTCDCPVFISGGSPPQ